MKITYYDSNLNTSYDIIILAFGAPRCVNQSGNIVYGIGKYGSAQGVYTPFTGGSNGIVNDVQQFINGYNNNPSHANKQRGIAIGVNTYADRITSNGGNFYDFGQALKSALTQVTLTGNITHIYAAIDAEQGTGCLPPSKVEPIINGFNNQTPLYSYSIINYGDDELGSPPGTKNGWTAYDIWCISYGAGQEGPIPEIYYSINADEWYSLSLWAYNNEGHNIFFWGVLSENGYDGTLTNSQSYNALVNDLISNPNTYQSELAYNFQMKDRDFQFHNP